MFTWVKQNPGKVVALLAAGGLGVGAGVSEHNKRKKARIDAATDQVEVPPNSEEGPRGRVYKYGQ